MRAHCLVTVLLAIGATGAALAPAGPLSYDNGQEKNGERIAYRGLDRNNDGKITRAEWRGSAQSFTTHDTNRDGILSGSELDPALRSVNYDDFSELDRDGDRSISRNEWLWDRLEFDLRDDNRDGSLTRAEYLDNSIGAAEKDFRDYDRNNDGMIGRGEWTGDRAAFERLDDNRDDVLSKAEYLNRTTGAWTPDFRDYDRNNDGMIGRGEWTGDRAAFDRLDRNRDDVLTRPEFLEQGNGGPIAQPPPSTLLKDRFARFASLDRNGNGRISKEEWPDDKKGFDALDDDNDGALNRDEYLEFTQDERIALFKLSDLNRNGSISKKEWNGGNQSFSKLDANADGLLTKDEFIKNYKGLDDQFRQLDRDNSGQLNRAEWKGNSKEFTRLDKNSNGQLTFDEFLPVV